MTAHGMRMNFTLPRAAQTSACQAASKNLRPGYAAKCEIAPVLIRLGDRVQIHPAVRAIGGGFKLNLE